ncbi:hypothetical protein KIN20_028640 [Parelaphostrongylus tenuis]|uniref:Uncharacterized protein n=1 Tax=Parelaphostrongylus tenuis TaxID=148309 RepID=A0AAD5R1D7_PARTN|nr:hypothetical protein KIN20_028617 [Parelaphostrongylus tenuis]KAJ1367674.1 hypothetical protein KIN20_028631 [Parelaphostrongylus tenuis]KAJ1367683.1 hypothetical protein KIN20_028640 [Parelaphostrongylus tenuis]
MDEMLVRSLLELRMLRSNVENLQKELADSDVFLEPQIEKVKIKPQSSLIVIHSSLTALALKIRDVDR